MSRQIEELGASRCLEKPFPVVQRAPRNRRPMSPSTRTKLNELAEAGISIGTSSWKYPGWCGQLYEDSGWKVS